MARIQDTRGRRDANSGYARLLGNPRLGLLISRLHATVIRTGNELERMLETTTPAARKTDLPSALSATKATSARGTKVVFSPRITGTSTGHDINGDIVVFDYSMRHLKVIEVKDGDTFDTKKASGELDSLEQSALQLSRRTGYKGSIYFCSFNQEDKQAIVAGAKGRFSPERVMTGRELCGILGVDFDAFRAARVGEQVSNLDYFLSELVDIPDIAKRLRVKLK